MAEPLQIINPATGALLQQLPVDPPTLLADKFVRAAMAQTRWAATPLPQRQAALRGFGQALESEAERLAALLTAETGKPLSQAQGEIRATLARVSWFVEQAPRVWADQVVHASQPLQTATSATSATGSSEPALQERISYEPLGVVGNISAWNYPYFVGTNVFVPALLAGNAVLYKPSEFATLTGLAMAELLHRSGVPNDVFVPVIGGGDVGAALLQRPLRAVFFTGSHATGLRVAQAAAAQLMKVQLELGGKDPAYVCDDVDLCIAAAATCDGAFYNAGQSCCAIERIYVHQKIYPAFLEAFLAEVDQVKMGDPMQPTTRVGPLTREAGRAVLAAQIDDAKRLGAKVLRGGAKVAGPGNFFAPTVLTDVNHHMALMREESFGPVIGIMSVANDDEALRLMNDTSYGLTASVFCAESARARRIMAQVDSGTVYINCCDRISVRLPWTGRHDSGLGVTLSEAGMRAVVQPKAWHQKSWPPQG